MGRYGLTQDLERWETYFFTAPISMTGRAMFYLIYKTTRGAKRGWFWTKVWRETFKAYNLRKPSKAINELERKGLIVGRLEGSVYKFERLSSVAFSYKEYPLPQEIGLDNPNEYGLYITYLLLANTDRTVLHHLVKFNNDFKTLNKARQSLIQKGYLVRLHKVGLYRIEVVPEGYKDLFLVRKVRDHERKA
jgi:hypothetical protein